MLLMSYLWMFSLDLQVRMCMFSHAHLRMQTFWHGFLGFRAACCIYCICLLDVLWWRCPGRCFTNGAFGRSHCVCAMVG